MRESPLPPPRPSRRVLAISLPLAASMASVLVMQFAERLFLSNYSLEAVAAVAPAGLATFLCMSFFYGMASYLSVFVAQYVGAARLERVGAVIWAGVYFSVLAGLILATLSLAAEALFALADHPAEVRRLEVVYFRILTLGSGLGVLGQALACFFSGRGLTRPIMAANLVGTVVYVPLAYGLINGRWGLPEQGVAGSALAVVVSWAVVAGIFAVLILVSPLRHTFGLRQGRAWDSGFLRRLLGFGLPSGLQCVIEVTAITCFVFLVGRLGKEALAVTNMVMAIESLAFVPMMGFSTGVGTLVGQAMGREQPREAARVVSVTLRITLAYMAVVCLCFLLAPEPLLELFRPRDISPQEYAPLVAVGTVVLRLVAFYRIFSGLGIVYIGALRGAGDVKFIMLAMAVEAVALLVLPLYLGLQHLGLLGAWGCLTAYVLVFNLTFALRYRRGPWRGMRVVESQGASPGARVD